MSLSVMFRIIGSPRESDVRNEEGNLADDRDLIADAMNDGGRASDRYVNNDSHKILFTGWLLASVALRNGFGRQSSTAKPKSTTAWCGGR